MILISLSASSIALSANAEKADSTKKAIIRAELSVFENAGKESTLTGHVEITRGTLLIRADAAKTQESKDGAIHATLTSTNNRQVFFRQKRDGGENLWIEGYADRIEYDEKTEIVKFISKAKVNYLESDKITQQLNAEFLSYDSTKDVFTATNSSSGKHVPGGGQITITSEPKNTSPTKTPQSEQKE